MAEVKQFRVYHPDGSNFGKSALNGSFVVLSSPNIEQLSDKDLEKKLRDLTNLPNARFVSVDVLAVAPKDSNKSKGLLRKVLGESETAFPIVFKTREEAKGISALINNHLEDLQRRK